jgi:hypothetical protein
MGMKRAKLPGPDLIRAAREFGKRRLWEILEDDEGFALVVPDRSGPTFGVVMGQSGQEFGVTLASGPYGRWNLHQMLYPEGDDHDILNRLSFWGMGLTPRSQLPPELRRAVKAAPRAFPPGEKFPQVLIKESGKNARGPTAQEEETLVYCLNGLCKVQGADAFRPLPFANAKVLTLTMSGPAADPTVALAYHTFPMKIPSAPTPAIALPDDLRRAARIPGRWICGFPAIPAEIDGDDRTVRALLIVDVGSGAILHQAILFDDEMPEAAEGLFALFRGTVLHAPVKGVPEEILFAESAFLEALKPALSELGVACRVEPDHPVWLKTLAGLAGFWR